MFEAGSSPRLRGTDRCPRRPGERLRFIPAPAGNSPSATAREPLGTVHPRACGEQAFIYQERKKPVGSSPRLRGTGGPVAVLTHGPRFIPAPAGNRVKARTKGDTITVHPRACGEQNSLSFFRLSRSGSSPRLRGNRSSQVASTQRSSVHPRACGEQLLGHGVKASQLEAIGSSPRLRGTVQTILHPLRRCSVHPAPAGNREESRDPNSQSRFIPAPAGNSDREL